MKGRVWANLKSVLIRGKFRESEENIGQKFLLLQRVRDRKLSRL